MAEELRRVRAVEDAVVAGERELHDGRTTISPSWTTGRGVISPTARIAACGGLITATKRLIPYMPRLETVNVPAGELGRGDLALADALGEARGLAGDLAERLVVGVEDRRHDERVLAGHGDADVDARVELELAVAVGAVRARERRAGRTPTP